ncbi:MAG: ATP synthase subunit C [Eubacteriales bacterium]|jgi:V/A-type H+-transporting ATPase subunit K
MKYLAALVLLVGMLAPLFAIYRKMVTGKQIKYAFATNALSFFCLCGLATLTGMGQYAQAAGEAAALTQSAAFSDGMKYLGAALATGVSCIGGGIAVAGAASAALGALSEDPKIMGKAMIFVALAEGIALYGVIISILILNN